MNLQETYIDLPCLTGVDGREFRGQMRVFKNKPPKLRFKPGLRVMFEAHEYEIVYVYRCMPDTQEWVYVLEERGLGSSHGDVMSMIMAMMDAGSTTPRTVYEIFSDSMSAWDYFQDIPCNGSRTGVPNKEMLKKASLKVEVIESGNKELNK